MSYKTKSNNNVLIEQEGVKSNNNILDTPAENSLGSFKTVTDNYTVTDDDYIIYVDLSNATSDIIIKLLYNPSVIGQNVYIYKIDTTPRKVYIRYYHSTGDYNTVFSGFQSDFFHFISIADGTNKKYVVGPKGDEGPQGIQGDTGVVGPQGATGLDGPQGALGPQGETGPTGPQGIQGEQGIQGPIGLDGPTGAVGPKGNVGNTGSQGEQGPKGDKGDTGTVVGTAGLRVGTVTDESLYDGPVDDGIIIQSSINPHLNLLNFYYDDGSVLIDEIITDINFYALDAGVNRLGSIIRNRAHTQWYKYEPNRAPVRMEFLLGWNNASHVLDANTPPEFYIDQDRCSCIKHLDVGSNLTVNGNTTVNGNVTIKGSTLQGEGHVFINGTGAYRANLDDTQSTTPELIVRAKYQCYYDFSTGANLFWFNPDYRNEYIGRTFRFCNNYNTFIAGFGSLKFHSGSTNEVAGPWWLLNITNHVQWFDITFFDIDGGDDAYFFINGYGANTNDTIGYFTPEGGRADTNAVLSKTPGEITNLLTGYSYNTYEGKNTFGTYYG